MKKYSKEDIGVRATENEKKVMKHYFYQQYQPDQMMVRINSKLSRSNMISTEDEMKKIKLSDLFRKEAPLEF